MYKKEIEYKFPEFTNLIKLNNVGLLNKSISEPKGDRVVGFYIAEKDSEAVVLGVYAVKCFQTEYHVMEYGSNENENGGKYVGWFYLGESKNK